MSVTVAVEQRPMAKRKGRPRTDRDDIAVRIERRLGTMLKAICTARGVPVAEYLSDITRATIGRDYAKMLREVDPEGPAKGGDA